MVDTYIKRIEIEEATFTLRNDGIVVVHFLEGTEITVELQTRMYDIYDEVCMGQKRPFLFTAMEFISITSAAKKLCDRNGR